MKNNSALPVTEAILSIASLSDPIVSKVILQVVHKKTEEAARPRVVRADDPSAWDERWFSSYE